MKTYIHDEKRDSGIIIEKKKNAKQKGKKFRKKRNTAEKCENLAENYLLEFQKA